MKEGIQKINLCSGPVLLDDYINVDLSRNADISLDLEADSLLDVLKRMHLLDGVTNPDVFGGLAGSHPIGAGYLGYAIPNWGVKFFADCLLQKLLPEHRQNYLG